MRASPHAGREPRGPGEIAARDRRDVGEERRPIVVRGYTRDEIPGRCDKRNSQAPSDRRFHRQNVRQEFRAAPRVARRRSFHRQAGDERVDPRQSDPSRSQVLRRSREIQAGEIFGQWEGHYELGGVFPVRDRAQDMHREQIRVDRDEGFGLPYSCSLRYKGWIEDGDPVGIRERRVQRDRENWFLAEDRAQEIFLPLRSN